MVRYPQMTNLSPESRSQYVEAVTSISPISRDASDCTWSVSLLMAISFVLPLYRYPRIHWNDINMHLISDYYTPDLEWSI